MARLREAPGRAGALLLSTRMPLFGFRESLAGLSVGHGGRYAAHPRA